MTGYHTNVIFMWHLVTLTRQSITYKTNQSLGHSSHTDQQTFTWH